MLDVWAGDINLGWATLAAAVLVVLPVQLLLCRRGKSLALRLAPLLLAAGLTAVGLLLSLCAVGWSAVGYMILALYGAVLMAACGVGWGIWALLRLIRRRV